MNAGAKIVLLDKWKAFQRAVTDTELNGTDLKVWARLLDHHNAKTGRCFPSQKKLAEAIGVTERSVRSSISKLSARNYLRKVANPVGKASNGYLLNFTGAEDAFRKTGSKFPKVRKPASAKTMNKQKKETGEDAGEDWGPGAASLPAHT